jgi:hypothetical protein
MVSQKKSDPDSQSHETSSSKSSEEIRRKMQRLARLAQKAIPRAQRRAYGRLGAAASSASRLAGGRCRACDHRLTVLNATGFCRECQRRYGLKTLRKRWKANGS